MECLSRSNSARVRDDGNGKALYSISNIGKGEIILSNAEICHKIEGNQQLCSFCLSSDIQQEKKLMKCSKCEARYCDKHCQKKDWKYHKKECSCYSEVSLFDVNTRQDLFLLLRYFPSFSSLQENCCYNSSTNSVTCGSSHLQQLHMTSNFNQTAQQPQQPQQPTISREVISLASRILEKSEQTIQDTLNKFRCNNFGILNDLFQCVAAGVYPAVALLNHSCRPNCILRSVISKGNAPLLQVIACRDIAEGEELTHSYTDLAEPKRTRQLKLQSIYNFTCQCPRCTSSQPISSFPRSFLTSGCYTSLLNSLSSPPSSSSSNLPLENVEIVIDETIIQLQQQQQQNNQQQNQQRVQQTIQEIVFALQLQLQRLSNVDDEIALLCQTIASLSQFCGMFHIELYKLRGQLFQAYLVAGDVDKATEICDLLVGYLQVAFSEVPNHPLLGLQLFTLGDLMTQKYERNRSKKQSKLIRQIYTNALEILTIAYGPSHDNVARLHNTIQSIN